MQTPSMVNEVSAIDVASTTLRWPCRGRRDSAILHRGVERPEQRHDLNGRIVDPFAEKILRAAYFRRPRQERQHRARVGAQRLATASAICRSSGASALLPR